MIKVVMDSTCGMTVEDFEKAGMVMVPLYIREGETLYRDGVGRVSSSRARRPIPTTWCASSDRSWRLETKSSVS